MTDVVLHWKSNESQLCVAYLGIVKDVRTKQVNCIQMQYFAGKWYDDADWFPPCSQTSFEPWEKTWQKKSDWCNFRTPYERLLQEELL